MPIEQVELTSEFPVVESELVPGSHHLVALGTEVDADDPAIPVTVRVEGFDGEVDTLRAPTPTRPVEAGREDPATPLFQIDACRTHEPPVIAIPPQHGGPRLRSGTGR